MSMTFWVVDSKSKIQTQLLHADADHHSKPKEAKAAVAEVAAPADAEATKEPFNKFKKETKLVSFLFLEAHPHLVQKEPSFFAWPAKIDTADLIKVNKLNAVLDPRFVDFEKLHMVTRKIFDEPKEFNVGSHRHHEPILARITNKVEHILKWSNVRGRIPSFGLPLSLVQKANASEVLSANREPNDSINLANKGAVPAPFAVDKS